jgi:hypothetical protein
MAVSQRWPELPILLVSGLPPAGWDDPFLAKPFTPEALIAAVSKLFADSKRARGQVGKPDHSD